MPERDFIIFWIFLLLFWEFSCPDRVRMKFGNKFFFIFFCFSSYLISFWLKITLKSGFIIFWIFLLLFWEFSCPDRVWMEFGNKIFFFSFSSYLISFWLKIMPERGILIFLIFYYIFRNFLARVEYERNSGLKFFPVFFGLSHLVLAKNNAEKWFYNFLNFFTTFLGIFLLRSSMNGIRD